jgi:E3 ubiquitin-protein ligase RBX1
MTKKLIIILFKCNNQLLIKMSLDTETQNDTFSENVKINKVHIRGYWNWNVHNSTCAICRNFIFEPSISSSSSESCAVVGVCNHAYHYDCISNWLKTRHNCPLCNSKWSYIKSK